MAIILCPFACCFKSCRSFKTRTEILEKSAERISQELDIIHLLHKIRLSNDLWSNLLGKRQKEMLKFQKSGVIDVEHLESSSSSHESSSSSDGKDHKFQQPTEFKQVFNEAIMHGLQVQQEERTKIKGTVTSWLHNAMTKKKNLD